jgi:hypothetical protein
MNIRVHATVGLSARGRIRYLLARRRSQHGIRKRRTVSCLESRDCTTSDTACIAAADLDTAGSATERGRRPQAARFVLRRNLAVVMIPHEGGMMRRPLSHCRGEGVDRRLGSLVLWFGFVDAHFLEVWSRTVCSHLVHRVSRSILSCTATQLRARRVRGGGGAPHAVRGPRADWRAGRGGVGF